MKILLHLSFVGTEYCGYQIQPNGVTVQERMNEATLALFGYPCDIVGCSRTDSGVHAAEFCVAVSKKGENFLETTIPTERIPQAINCFLPKDIAVFFAESVEDEFHPRYDAHYKEYIYRIWNRTERNPFWEDRAWHCPRPIGEEAIARMNEAAKTWIGTKDFASYMASGSKITDTVRTVLDAKVLRTEQEIIEFHVSANGFLYHMVRIFMGTLIDVAYEKISVQDVIAITEAHDRRLAGQTAPACGLYLNRVVYPKNIQ